MNREDYPTLNAPSPNLSGAVFTPELFDKAATFLKSPEYRRQVENARVYAEQQYRDHQERIERWWLGVNGAAEMTPELRRSLDDTIWEWYVENTNILEIF